MSESKTPLTDEQLAKMAIEDEFVLYYDVEDFIEIARAVELAHGIKDASTPPAPQPMTDAEKSALWHLRQIAQLKPEDSNGGLPVFIARTAIERIEELLAAQDRK